MALSDLRTLSVPYNVKLANKTSFAHFVISIVNGPKADNVIFASGAPELRNAIAFLAEVKYPQTFPDATPARVIRKVTMSCSIYTTKGCVLVLLPIGDAAVALALNRLRAWTSYYQHRKHLTPITSPLNFPN